MVNKNYRIKREDIYVGKLGMFNVNPTLIGKSIRCYTSYNGQMFGYDNDTYRLEEGDYFVYDFRRLRTILFCLNENHFSNDLLYNSPEYPILNITDNQLIEEKYDVVNSTILRYARNLSSLLSFFDFPDLLTHKDIIKIIHTFFTGHFVQNNLDLFGGSLIEEDYLFHYESPVTEYPSILPIELRFILDYLGDIDKKNSVLSLTSIFNWEVCCFH